MQPTQCAMCVAIQSQLPPGSIQVQIATKFLLFSHGLHNGFCDLHHGQYAQVPEAIFSADLVTAADGSQYLANPVLVEH